VGAIEIFSKLSAYAVPLMLLIIPIYAYIKKVAVYESFVAGAAEGVQTSVKILPFLVGMMMSIAVFRASGAFDALAGLIAPIFNFFGVPVEVLPLAIMRPLSGSGALALSAQIVNDYGPDSFIGRLASVMQGSTDTTFYVLAVYFGSVSIRKYRYALAVGLSADIVSFISSVIVCRMFFG
jgi:spore maturation protein B